LDVVEWLGRYVSEKNDVQVAQIHAQLEGRRAAQDVDAPLLKIALELPGLLFIDLRGVFLDTETVRPPLLIEASVVVSSQGLRWLLLKAASASWPWAMTTNPDRGESQASLAPEDRIGGRHRFSAVDVCSKAVGFPLGHGCQDICLPQCDPGFAKSLDRPSTDFGFRNPLLPEQLHQESNSVRTLTTPVRNPLAPTRWCAPAD
jgi:hypothetical protein